MGKGKKAPEKTAKLHPAIPDNQAMNEFHFSGEIFYLKPMDGEFTVSIRVRGLSSRAGAMSTQICELSCLGQHPVFDSMKQAGIDVYSKVELSGHMETWTDKKGNPKTMLILDSVSKI